MSKVSATKKSQLIEIAGVLIAGIVAIHLISSVNQADLQVFIRAGKSVLHGQTPYPKVGTPAVYSGSSFVYPYLVAVAFVPISLLGTYWGPFVFEAISLIALFFATYTFSTFLRSGVSNTVASQISIFAAVLLASPTLISLQMGTLTPLILAAFALIWRYRSGAAVGALLVVALTFTKVYLVVFGLFFILGRRLRAIVFTFVFTLAALVLNFILSPLGPSSYLRLLTQLAMHESLQGFSYINALGSIDLSKGGAYGILALGIVIVLALWSRSSSLPKRDDIAFVVAIAATLMATPILWSSYLPVLLVPLLLFVDNFALLAALSAISSVIVTPDRAGTLMIAIQFLAICLVMLPRYFSRLRYRELNKLFSDLTFSSALILAMLFVGFAVEVIAPALGVQFLIIVISIVLVLRSSTFRYESRELVEGPL